MTRLLSDKLVGLRAVYCCWSGKSPFVGFVSVVDKSSVLKAQAIVDILKEVFVLS